MKPRIQQLMESVSASMGVPFPLGEASMEREALHHISNFIDSEVKGSEREGEEQGREFMEYWDGDTEDDRRSFVSGLKKAMQKYKSDIDSDPGLKSFLTGFVKGVEKSKI